MRRLITGAALVAALAGCGSGPPARGISLAVSQSPFRVSVLVDGKPVVAEDAAARLRFELSGKGEEYALTTVLSHSGGVYRVATSEPGRTATVTVAATATGARLTISLHPAAGVFAVYDAFDTPAGTHFLGGGEQGRGVDLAGQIAPFQVTDACSYAPVPYFASSAGWGLRLASENVGAFAFPGSSGGEGCQPDTGPACSFPALSGRAEVCVQGASLSEDLYLGSIPALLRDYEAATGAPAVPPPAELELIKWRDVVSGPAQVLQDITRLQRAQIPLGWVELDNPWEPCVGELTFDRSRIPDPGALIARVHAAGVRFMLWVSPKAICPAGYPRGGLLGPASDRVLDLRKPGVVAVFQARLRALFRLGVDGVKADRGDEVDLRGVSPSLTNRYPLLYARAVLAVMPRGDAGIFRAATAGSQAILPGMWAGDQPGVWVGLQRAIVEAQTAAMSGFSTWGSDIGGYSSAGLSAELFERWAQLGALSPVMEVGGSGPNATPWVLGSAAMDDLRSSAILHYELYPYLYRLLQRREPVLAPLGYAFPADAHAWASPFELMVGPDLLAAPVTGPGTTPSVYLPAGSWVDLFSGTTVAGGGPSFTRPTPDSAFPLYLRAGAVIPFNLRTAAGSWWGVNELSHPGRTGLLATDGAVLGARGLPGAVQIFVPAPTRPARVSVGGRAVAWSWNAGPLPGVVIRLPGVRARGRVVLSGP